jgi:hypothetical protein
MLRRAEELTEVLAKMAEERKTPVFSGENAWYGLDPIHPRRRSAGEIWSRMLGELFTPGQMAPLVRATPSTSLALRRLNPECWKHFGFARRAVQPAARLSDGTTIALYYTIANSARRCASWSLRQRAGALARRDRRNIALAHWQKIC